MKGKIKKLLLCLKGISVLLTWYLLKNLYENVHGSVIELTKEWEQPKIRQLLSGKTNWKVEKKQNGKPFHIMKYYLAITRNEVL